MLLWEHLGAPPRREADREPNTSTVVHQTVRLPFDTRCMATTKSGRRCRGRVLTNKECCMFHDPETAAKRERARSQASSRRRKLALLPGGYLRRITSRRAVGEAMDRLYREIRLGVITPEMGRVLFDVLNRLLDSGLADQGAQPRAPHRSKASRIRPKVQELLTRAERRAWRRAVEAAPASRFKEPAEGTPLRRPAGTHKPSQGPNEPVERALTIPFQAAS